MLELTSIPKHIRDCWKPKPTRPIMPWIKDNIYLPKNLVSVSQRFSDFHFPYQKGVLEAFADEDTREISLMWGTQLGKTNTETCAMLYLADNKPGPTIFVTPSEPSLRLFSKTRLYPTLESCRALKDQVLPEHARALETVELDDMVIYMGYSGSPDALSAKTCKYVMLTEVDKFSRKYTGEADPVELAYERAKAFKGTEKVFVEGTPTIRGISRIDTIYQNSDRRKYHVPCPHCGRYQILIKDQIKGIKDEHGTTRTPDVAKKHAYYECIHCQEKIHDHHKMNMMRQGQWVRDGQYVTEKGVIAGEAKNPCERAGFHLSSIYSNAIGFGDFIKKFLEALKKPHEKLQNFVNSWLAEAWEDTVIESDPEQLRKCALTYPEGEVPEHALFLTAGVDVQDDHFWGIIRAWGYHEESWLIRNERLANWDEVAEMMFNTRYPQAVTGNLMHVLSCGVDSGHKAHEVYQFCRLHPNYCRPVKGASDKIGKFNLTFLDKDVNGIRNKEGLALVNVDTDYYKTKITGYTKAKPGAHGEWHLYADPDDAYIYQFCAEHKVSKLNKRLGRLVYKWELKPGQQHNHYFDCEVYSACVADVAGIPNLREPNSENIFVPKTKTPKQEKESPW